ncbi:TetR/AcrR family transcriptional regulator [Gordonia sp. HY002]|uniref:TetR/AcrR family transcriptional regulator n=1 Tax=Gordonia zhenghanii TaxID=2911516 RepID=UPI001EEFEAA9|nr:TetR/AcrR family transcriptional regulator [Gordonia zhenghanii]MCF8569974.1 TetR/AcrR family transcriptional regulator [Gordonia zhenghanii]MCF8604341.1 TetR/AcrR family transcriptional regulator [Gordonia zhenghanii]
MGRRPKFSTNDLLDAALQIAVDEGPAAVTAAAVARSTGAPSGSVYHRFAGSDEILARLWIRTIAEFQTGFVDALADTDTAAAADAAIAYVFDWCGANPGKARLLLTFDERGIDRRAPHTVAAELRERNATARAALEDWARRHFDKPGPEEFDRAMYALVDLPYGAVRRHLPDGRPRQWLRDSVTATAREVISSTD